MRAVNLLQNSRQGRDRLRTSKTIAVTAGVAAILVAALAGVAFTKAHSDVSSRQDTLQGLHGELATVQAKAAVSDAATGQTQAHLAAVSAAASGRVAWDGMLGQLSRVMPRDAWLESLQATKSVDPAAAAPSTTPPSSTPATSGVPTGFVLTGYTKAQATVPQVLERLVLLPGLSDVTLQSSERTDVGTKKAIKFTIGANVRSPGGIN